MHKWVIPFLWDFAIKNVIILNSARNKLVVTICLLYFSVLVKLFSFSPFDFISFSLISSYFACF